MDLAELLTVETSVLQTLCMSAGSESSELRDTILRELDQGDFYFPITRTIYIAVSEMSRNNTPVDADSLMQALNRRSVDVPDDFFQRSSCATMRSKSASSRATCSRSNTARAR